MTKVTIVAQDGAFEVVRLVREQVESYTPNHDPMRKFKNAYNDHPTYTYSDDNCRILLVDYPVSMREDLIMLIDPKVGRLTPEQCRHLSFIINGR